MFVNILVFVILLLATVGAGWLTVKAVRAGRLWVKISGGLGAGLLTLILAAVTLLGGRGIAYMYFSSPDPAPDLTVAGTPEQIARGQYLADIGCIGCHGTYQGALFETDPEFPLAGGADLAAAEEALPPIGRLVAENLTPGGKLAGYSDGEIFRAIRHGVSRDGHMLAFMPLLPFGQMSDEDLTALIAFLRSQPAVASAAPTGTELNYLGMVFFGAGLFPAAEEMPGQIAAPPPGDNPEYGKYVATFGECRACHGPDMTGSPATAFSPAFPNPRPRVATWTLDQFVETMRSGVRPGNDPFPDTMPWQNASKMSDDDLAALYAYLTAAP